MTTHTMAPPGRSWPARVAHVAKTVAWCLLAAGFLLSWPILNDAAWWMVLVVGLVGALLALPGAAVAKRFWHGTLRSAWWRIALVLTAILAMLLAAPIYWLAIGSALRPAVLPQVVLTNGKKTVTFQGMTHIGSEAFYKAVFYDLERALSDDAVIYYEGVKPDPVGDAWLNRMIAGDKGLNDAYTGIAQACGLVFQNQVLGVLSTDMKKRPEQHIVADVSSLEMKQEFDRLMATDPAFAERMKPRLTDHGDGKSTLGDGSLRSVIDWLKHGTDGQRALAGTVCRGMIGHTLARSAKKGEVEDPLDRVILDFRNRALADRIAAEPKGRIFITYGAGHLPGLLALLKAKDPAWHVATVKWVRALQPPEQLSGSLDLSP